MLSDQQIHRMAGGVVKALRDEQVEFLQPLEAIEEAIRQVLTRNMEEEKEINDACDRLMDQYAREIDRGSLDPRKVFQMIKTKLARERGFIL